ncbi:MAG: esterase, partial [Flavobacteriaceae bacterium]|nr:esterase [Flavobacteriaceae bacterium]
MNIRKILIIGLTALVISSCESKKSKSNSESKFYTDSIYSKHLDEYRKHNIYLPNGFNNENKYPVLYATDGSTNIKSSFIKKTLDSLIKIQVIKPIIYVGSHSNNNIADSTLNTPDGKMMYLQYRNFEYTKHYNIETIKPKLADRFEKHMQYFKDELITNIEQQFNQKIDKKDRYFYGVSNGAGFGLSLLNSYPNKIGSFLCFSTFGGNIQSSTWKDDTEYPKLYMEYGSEEHSFLKEDADYLKRKYEKLNLFGEFNEYDGGGYSGSICASHFGLIVPV